VPGEDHHERVLAVGVVVPWQAVRVGEWRAALGERVEGELVDEEVDDTGRPVHGRRTGDLPVPGADVLVLDDLHRLVRVHLDRAEKGRALGDDDGVAAGVGRRQLDDDEPSRRGPAVRTQAGGVVGVDPRDGAVGALREVLDRVVAEVVDAVGHGEGVPVEGSGIDCGPVLDGHGGDLLPVRVHLGDRGDAADSFRFGG
jgi:hypothetical protein